MHKIFGNKILFYNGPKRSRFWLELSSNFFINLIATLIGVFIGFKITLDADRQKQMEFDRKVVIEKIASDSIYNHRTILLIRKELLENRSVLAKKKAEVKNNTSYALYSPTMINSSWKAIINSGGLLHFKDLDLLELISNAYRHIEYIIFLDETQMQRATPAGSTTWNNGITGNIKAAEREGGELPLAEKSINEALNEINKKYP